MIKAIVLLGIVTLLSIMQLATAGPYPPYVNRGVLGDRGQGYFVNRGFPGDRGQGYFQSGWSADERELAAREAREKASREDNRGQGYFLSAMSAQANSAEEERMFAQAREERENQGRSY